MRKRVLVDVTISCDPPPYRRWGGYTQEQYAKHCSDWVREFEEFMRDHRSQDPVFLNVERKYEDQCEFCGSTDFDPDPQAEPYCCDDAVAEWRANQVVSG
jgi:hypothetical protein